MAFRILTISDIHYKPQYDSDNHVKAYFASFAEKVKELHLEKPIDVFVISGDLAFSGRGDEYKSLADKISEWKLNIPVYAIPGNHDVNWINLKEALGDQPLEKLFSIGDEILKDVTTEGSKYKEVFDNFRLNFLEYIKREAEIGTDEYEFCKKTYSGYLWCKEKDVVLMFLNSSWLSFGPGVIEKYYNQLISSMDEKRIRKEIVNFLGEPLSQEGKQSYSFTYYPYYERINNLLSSNPDLKVITFAHHPPHWLDWKEQFMETNEKKRNLDEVLNFSHLLITGHLHSPVQAPSILNGKTHHLSNGAFLDYHFVDLKDVINPISKFPNNWFNIIEIDSSDFGIWSYKFIVKKALVRGAKFEYGWQLFNTTSSKFEFVEKAKETGTPSISKEKSSAMIAEEFVPTNLSSISTILKLRRQNDFKFYGKDIRVDINSVHCFSYKDDSYLVLVNSLERLHGVLKKAKKFSDLKKEPLFVQILDALNRAENGLPVIALYDFLKPGSLNKDPVAYSEYYNKKFIIFQSFKHDYFSKFEELYKFSELNIVYDAIFK